MTDPKILVACAGAAYLYVVSPGPAFLALGATVFGWSEWALHLTSVLPAIAVVLGTCRLAGKFCARPVLAGLAVLFAPVFLVSSTSVMCDVPMLACWVWAVVSSSCRA